MDRPHPRLLSHRRAAAPPALVVGGNSDAALRRVAAIGDGWYGFNLSSVEAVRERLAVLETVCQQTGHDIAWLDLAVALDNPRPDDVAALAEMGVRELVLVATPGRSRSG